MRGSCLALCFLSLFCLPAQGEIYKWVDKDGKTHFTQKPPPSTALDKQVMQKKEVDESTYPELFPGDWRGKRDHQEVRLMIDRKGTFREISIFGKYDTQLDYTGKWQMDGTVVEWTYTGGDLRHKTGSKRASAQIRLLNEEELHLYGPRGQSYRLQRPVKKQRKLIRSKSRGNCYKEFSPTSDRDEQLSYLVENACTARLELLLGRGTNANHRLKRDTLLTLATRERHGDVVSLLLQSGASVDLAASRRNETPLMIAAKNGDHQMVEVFLAAGARINMTNHRGRTALMLAAKQGHAGIVDALLVKGAKPRLRDEARYDALGLAKRAGHHKVIRVLETWLESHP